MSTDREAVRKFFRQYSGTAVGATPIQPTLQPEDEESTFAIDRTVEHQRRQSPDGQLLGSIPRPRERGRADPQGIGTAR